MLSLSFSVPLLTFCALPQLRFLSSPHLLRSLSFSHPLLTFCGLSHFRFLSSLFALSSFSVPLLTFCALSLSLLFGLLSSLFCALLSFSAPLLTFCALLIFGSSPHFLRSLSLSLCMLARRPGGPQPPKTAPEARRSCRIRESSHFRYHPHLRPDPHPRPPPPPSSPTLGKSTAVPASPLRLAGHAYSPHSSLCIRLEGTALVSTSLPVECL